MGCGNICALPSKHDGDCLCNNSPEEHLCNGKCYLSSYARNCKLECQLSAGHSEDHICCLDEESHLCNKECHLKNFSRIGCKNKCHLYIMTHQKIE